MSLVLVVLTRHSPPKESDPQEVMPLVLVVLTRHSPPQESDPQEVMPLVLVVLTRHSPPKESDPQEVMLLVLMMMNLSRCCPCRRRRPSMFVDSVMNNVQLIRRNHYANAIYVWICIFYC